METFTPMEIPVFKTHEEEISFLRSELSKKEKALAETGTEVKQEIVAEETINEYKNLAMDLPRPKEMQVKKDEAEEFVLRLKPEDHDTTMEELLSLMMQKGIVATLEAVAELNDPHIDADFHRFLVQYLCETHVLPGVKDTSPLYRTVDMRLFEIILPEPENEKDNTDFKALITAMEQFYAGMHSIAETRNNKERAHFSLEIVLANNTDHIIFYASVPSEKASLLEKHVFGVHPKARINEIPDDYNVFPAEGGKASASYGTLKNYDIFPIKTFDTFDHDPLNILINVFTKLKRSGEGAAIQLTVMPQDEEYIDRFHHVLEEVKKGEKVKVAMQGTLSRLASGFGKLTVDLISGKTKNDKDQEKRTDDEAIGYIQEKVKRPIMGTTLRVVATSSSKDRADNILAEIESGFNQFTESHRNGIEFKRVSDSNINKFLHEFTYRTFDKNLVMALNLSELATIFHFPYDIENSPQLKQAKAAGSPAPIEMGDVRDDDDGVLLGYNSYRGITTPIFMRTEDRMRHLYVIGQTGVGKSGILRTMISQDIAKGHGCCFIDPHGNDIQDILSYVPKERIDDVIYFDPAYTPRPMALNMLEFDPRFQNKKQWLLII
jgi:translation elongation factor EF-1beta